MPTDKPKTKGNPPVKPARRQVEPQDPYSWAGKNSEDSPVPVPGAKWRSGPGGKYAETSPRADQTRPELRRKSR